MRRVIITSRYTKDDCLYEKPQEGYLIQFTSCSNPIYGIVELPDGSIKSYSINQIKYKYPTKEGE